MHPASSFWQRIANKFYLPAIVLRSVSRKEVETPVGAHRKSIVKEALDRLDNKMAISQSRREAKQAIREEQGLAWSVSTGMIHSFKTRSVYQEHAIRFLKWARSTHHVTSLAQLDPRADELATAYLQQQLAEGKSPYTLQVERTALRLFFDNRQLAASITLPRRERRSITRSRGVKSHDRHFQPENWPELLNFLRAVGLRRNELRLLRVRDIIEQDPDYFGQTTVKVINGKGGRSRTVQVLPGHEAAVLSVVTGRDPDTPVFARIPKHLDVHSYRREFAQALYLYHAPGRALPPATGRLKPSGYDRAAAQQVTEALGHNRIDVVLRHYVR